jgi:DNA-binding NarL/FixJ family response regulator
MEAGPLPTSAVVVAGDEEIRVLIRGLLRLHHFRVLGEAEGEAQGLDLVRIHTPRLLVVDDHLSEGSIYSLFEGARRIVPTIRTVLVAAEPPPPGAAEGEPNATLRRPFRVREFAEAVGAALPAGPPRAT